MQEPIIHEQGCAWETGPHCTCGADPGRADSAENDAPDWHRYCGASGEHYPHTWRGLSGLYCPGKRVIPPEVRPLPIHRTEAGYPNCSTCDGGGCPDCTDPA
jgi:hypothetical protein